MAKTFWERGEEYAKKVSAEIIEQINRGDAPRGRSRGNQENRTPPKTFQPASSTPAATAFT